MDRRLRPPQLGDGSGHARELWSAINESMQLLMHDLPAGNEIEPFPAIDLIMPSWRG
jgi:hypothetical protein